MTGRLILSVFLGYLISSHLYSQPGNITIQGKDRDYASKTIEFFRYTERIFDSTEPLSKAIADSSGSFSVSFSLSETQCIYCYTPLYTAYIYAEPGKTYHINLPPSTAKTEENTNNPFFLAPFWHIVPTPGNDSGKPELNEAISNFNKQFEPFLDKQILRYYNPQLSREKLDSFRLANISIPELENKEYYETYLLYKLAGLEFIDKEFSRSELCEKYLKAKPARPDVPSWWDFFNLYFDGYFSSLSQKKEFSELYALTGKGEYWSLNQLLKKDPALQDDRIREWVILKEIHNAYYGNNLPLSTYLSLCDSLLASSSDKLSRSISRNLKKDAPSLLPGNSPPSALLKNTSGEVMEIQSSKGKYSYIGFCSLNNLECQQEFEYLKYFYHKHGKYLNILIIVPESESDKIESFTDENAIPWKFWYSEDSKKILKDYKVRAFPVFYLLDREGKLLMSPAILPSAGFEKQLFNILKSKGDI